MNWTRILFLITFLIIPHFVFADVYPFEEEYSHQSVLAQLQEEAIQQTAQPADSEEARSPQRYQSYRQITFRNCGAITLNLVKGIGKLYAGFFTEALPEYGSDIIQIPVVTAEVAGRFVEIERQVLFERDAKEKDIQAYIAAQQTSLTPEEEKLLQELRNKPITATKK